MKYFRLTLLLCLLFSCPLDLATTVLCLKYGGIELNPLARTILFKSPFLFIFLKLVIPPLYLLGMYHAYLRFPYPVKRVIEFLVIAYLITFIIVVLNNLFVLTLLSSTSF